jgi:hypothetical protein
MRPRVWKDHLLQHFPKVAKDVGVTRASRMLALAGPVDVYRVGRYALKFTAQRAEANNARMLVGRRLKHVVYVRAVHRVGAGWWLIQTSLLESKSPEPAGAWKNAAAAGVRELFQVTGKLYTDIHKGNVLWCPRTQRLKVIDFEYMERCSEKRFEKRLWDLL